MFHVNPVNWGTDEDFFRFGPHGVSIVMQKKITELHNLG